MTTNSAVTGPTACVMFCNNRRYHRILSFSLRQLTSQEYKAMGLIQQIMVYVVTKFHDNLQEQYNNENHNKSTWKHETQWKYKVARLYRSYSPVINQGKK